MLAAVWKTIGLFMALAAFLAVGAGALLAGEELVWTVGKAVAAFALCWIAMGFLGNVLQMVLERQDASASESGNGEVSDR